MAQSIKYGVTSQTLSHVPMGLASSVTYVIEDLSLSSSDAARVLGSGAATVSSWTSTTDAAAGRTQANPARIPITSTAGITIGDPAVIVGLNGARELVVISALRSNDYVDIRSSLAGEYESGSTLAGVKISATVPDAVSTSQDIFEQRRPLRVVWTYTVDNVKHIVPEPIEFVRHDAAFSVGEILSTLRVLYPDLASRLPENASNLDTLVKAIVETHVLTDLKARHIEPSTFLSGPSGKSLAIARIIHHFATMGYGAGSSDPDPDRTWREYERHLNALTIGQPGEGVTETNLTTDTSAENPSKNYRGPTLRM